MVKIGEHGKQAIFDVSDLQKITLEFLFYRTEERKIEKFIKCLFTS